jgi:multiple sugar transport system permease protein
MDNLLRRAFLLSLLMILPSVLFAQGRVVLRVSNWADYRELPPEEEIIKEFMRLHPDVDVQLEPITTPDYQQKILTGVVSGSPPDVFLLDSGIMPAFMNKGVLLNFMPYIRKHRIDLEQFFPNVLAIALRRDEHGDSALYALPKDFTPLVMYYNKKLFDREHLPYPKSGWTWDEYLDLSMKLTRDLDGDGQSDQFGTIFVNLSYYWAPFLWQVGGDVLSSDGTQASGFFNSPKTEYALQHLIDLRAKHRVAPAIGPHAQVLRTGVARGLFTSGKIGMIVNGHWALQQYKPYIESGEIDIGVVPLPVLPGGKKANVMYESGYAVPVTTRHPELAVELAAFLTGAYANRIRGKTMLAIPSVKTVAEEQAKADPYGLEKVFYNEVAYCRQPWGSLVERFNEIEQFLNDAVDDVTLNGRDIHEAFTEYAKRIDARLEQIRSVGVVKFEPLKGNPEVLRFLFGVLGVTLLLAVTGIVVSRRKERRSTLSGFGFLLPSALHLTVFLFTPILFAFYLSFHRWDIIVPQKPFVGLQNFSEIFLDPLFYNALRNTFLFTLNVPVTMVLALFVAVLLTGKYRGVNFHRTLYFLPSISSLIAIAIVWTWLYNPQFGLANYLLGFLGLPPQPWLGSTSTALVSVMIMSVWIGLGYQMVIFIAGLQGIPGELYEASLIDGANAWQRFRRVTLPMLKPTTFFILVTSFIGSFQVFSSIYIMTGGGPIRSTDVLVYHIYQNAWMNLRMGYASAMSLVLFLIIMFATWVQFRLMGREMEFT